MINLRADLERAEDQKLAPYGIRSAASRGRTYSEPESHSRTAFQRDRDRIIHTTAFRRLEYKTQVFVFYEGDHYRTRLTHTLEVAQLGRAFARGLGANEDLAEAICLAHDLGHSPFGHAGEHILNKLMANHGGFNHNTQSYRIVTELEVRYPDFDGLNLTYETREGMIKHETDYDDSDASRHGYDPNRRASLEAQIANYADEVAYNAHDLDDGLRAGLFPQTDLESLDVWCEACDAIGWDRKTPMTDLIRHHINRELIGMMVSDVIENTNANLVANNLATADAIQMHHENVVGYSPTLHPKIKALKQFLFQRMYRHYRLMRMQDKAERFISQLFEAYVKEPGMLPADISIRLTEHSPERVVADYIAGMTDRYALDEWEKLFDPYRRV